MALLTREQVTNQPLAEGDAGIILKEDGTFRIFQLHSDADPANMTESQRAQTKKLMALACALQVPQLMRLLEDCSTDPNIVGEPLDLGQLH